jgi:hypothetical protein
VPIFCGVGGGVTGGRRSIEVARDAGFHGALGVVLDAPASNDLVSRIKTELEIPVLVTVVSPEADVPGRVAAGADILNVSARAATPEVVAGIRDRFPVVQIIEARLGLDEG